MPEQPIRAFGSVREALNIYWETYRRNTDKIERHNRNLSEDDELPPYVYQEYPKAMYPLGYPQEETALAKDLREEQRWIAEGYYPSLTEQQQAREAFESEMGETDESDSAETAPARGAGGRFRKKGA